MIGKPLECPMQWSEEDRTLMQRAIELAECGRGKVSPNPLVGCVIVKDGKIVAEGWHDHLGGLHAEQMAIHDAEQKGIATKDCTAYVTLEPCNHFGRTPPCTESLLWAGISKVIIAHEDPNPNVRGEGISVLEDANITVEKGLLKEEAAAQMRYFLHWCEHRKPFVTIKVAVDANGSVDDLAEDSQRFTSQECLVKVHELRRDCDAILVGVNTVIRDDPSLTVRHVDCERQPLRLVIDPNSRIPENAILLNDSNKTMLLQSGFNGLQRLLEMLGDMEVQHLLVEGGPATIAHFLEQDIVDEFFLVQSDVVHNQPVLVEFDLSKLTRGENLTWGEENVHCWKREAAIQN